MRNAFIAFAFLASLAGLAAAPQSSPQNPQQATPVFKTSVDLIQVDVSVLDRTGAPVEGLTAADFTLYESGVAQEVEAFSAVSVPAPETGAAPWLRDVTPDVRTNALGDGRLFALVIDDATMPFDVRTLSNVRRIAREVITRMGANDLTAIIFTRDSRRSIDFTNDRPRLLAGVEAGAAGAAYTDPQTDNWNYFSSVSTLSQVSSYLARVPQRRKALIYVSTGVPVNYETVSNFTPLSPNRPTSMLEEATSESLVQSLMEFVEARPQDAYGSAMDDAFVRAQNGNVNIYSIDPAGLGGLQAFLEKRTTVSQADRVTRGATPMVPVRSSMLDAYQTARLSRDYLRTVAETSGGRAFLENNDITAGVTQIFRENSSYYLLGYRSTREPGDRRIRKVEVKVQRDDATAHTRNAYFDPRSRPKRADLTPPLQLADALSGVLPSSNLPLQATAAAFAGPDRKSATVAITVGIEHTVPGDVGARVQDMLQLQTTALTPRGEAKASRTENAQGRFRSGVGENAQYEILTRLTLAPGRYQIRIAAHSALLNRNGSVYLDVEVPDFGATAVQLSGVVLSAQPAWRAVPADGFADLLPLVPTTVREFDTTSAVTAFARVYDRARRPLPVETRITDERGEVLFRQADTLAADRFDTAGAADHRITVPVSRLRPGRYLLTIETNDGKGALARHARFAMR